LNDADGVPQELLHWLGPLHNFQMKFVLSTSTAGTSTVVRLDQYLDHLFQLDLNASSVALEKRGHSASLNFRSRFEQGHLVVLW
jgi:hypothetical protein